MRRFRKPVSRKATGVRISPSPLSAVELFHVEHPPNAASGGELGGGGWWGPRVPSLPPGDVVKQKVKRLTRGRPLAPEYRGLVAEPISGAAHARATTGARASGAAG